jgi:hypothetical protein
MDFNHIQYLGVYTKIYEVTFKLVCISKIQSAKIKLQ